MSGPVSFSAADIDQINIQFAGVDMGAGAGWADDDVLTLTPAQFFTSRRGADGSRARGKTNDHSLTIKFRLLQTSALNAILSAIAMNDVAQPNGAGVGSFVVIDLQGTTLVRCQHCWIDTPPEAAFNAQPGIREWTFMGDWDVYLLGGS